MTGPQHDLIAGEIEGLKTLFVLPSVPDRASPTLREGLVRRRISMINGTCPCGGRRARLSRAQRRAAQRGKGVPAGRLQVEHEEGCPAVSAEVEDHIRGFRWAP